MRAISNRYNNKKKKKNVKMEDSIELTSGMNTKPGRVQENANFEIVWDFLIQVKSYS